MTKESKMKRKFPLNPKDKGKNQHKTTEMGEKE